MAKNRKKNKNKDPNSMDITRESNGGCAPQAMDTSEGAASKSSVPNSSKIKKSVMMKRSKNLRKRRAVERAISKSEKSEEEVLKKGSKKLRIQSAKSLYG